jgi:hypothetical protein
MDKMVAPLYCAVDREPIGQRNYYALTVNAITRDVIMLAFCLDHRAEWLQMREVVRREGWR